MCIEIRKINQSDFSALLSLIKELALFQNHLDRVCNSVEQMNIESEYLKGFVAVQNNEIIGFTTYFFGYYTWVGKGLYLDDLYVKQEFRGQGVGTKLIKTVIDFAKKENCKRVRWQVAQWNQSAIQFYESLGATVCSEEYNCDLLL